MMPLRIARPIYEEPKICPTKSPFMVIGGAAPPYSHLEVSPLLEEAGESRINSPGQSSI